MTRPIVTTHLVMRARTGPGAIRVAFMEPCASVARTWDRHPREPAVVAVVAVFAGAETTRLWRASERFSGGVADWSRRKAEVLAELRPEWETIHVRYEASTSRARFAAALGGRPSAVLGPGFDDAFEFPASVPPSGSGADRSWRAGLRHSWREAYGWEAHAAEQALRACPAPPDPFATATPAAPEAGPFPPHAPIHVSTHAVRIRCGDQRLRYAIVENEGRVLPDGRWRICAAVVGLRRHDGFGRFALEVVEARQDDWEGRRSRLLDRWGGEGSDVVATTATTFPTRAAFVDAVGPRFLKAIGGRETLDVLTPPDAPRDVLPLRAVTRRRVATTAPSATRMADAEDPLDPMFGAF